MPNDIHGKKFNLRDILSLSRRIFWERGITLLVIAVAVYLPVTVAFEFAGKLIRGQDVLRNMTNALMLQFLASLFNLPAAMTVAFVVEQALTGNEIRFGKAFEEALSKWAKAIGTYAMSSIIVGFLAMLFVIPGIIWAVYYYFIVFIVILRDKWWNAALGYSKALVKGRWLEVFSVIFMLGLLEVALFAVVELSFTWQTLGLAAYPFMRILLYIIESIITTFFTVASVVYFLNLDYRKDAMPAGNDWRFWEGI